MEDSETRKTESQTVDIEVLRRWIANCDPTKPIDPAGELYFNLDQVEVDGEIVSLRGDDHLRALADAVQLSEGGSSCQLFSGFSGTGKSTELRRLAYKLEAAGFSVLVADAEDYHSLSRPLTVEDLMVVTAGAFGEATAARLGRDVAEDSYWKRLVDFLRQDVEIREVKLPAGLADLKIGIKYAGPFWIEVRDAVARSHGKLRDHSHSFIRRCVASLSQAEPHSRGTVFILDSLERLSPPMMSQFEEVMNSVLRVLSEYPSFLRIPDCHAIYTVPPYVRLVSLRVAQHYDGVTHVLPAIKVAERGPAPKRYPPGVDALITLLDRRIPLAEVFGDRRDLLEQLIVYSGGHVRTFLSFVRDLLKHSLRSGLPPSEKAIEEVVQYYREPARLAVFREYVPVLHKVLENGTLEGMTREERAMVGALMDENLVLCYRNGEGWFEVHPLVRDLVQELAAEIEAEQSP